jgi:hypothetical protein
MQGVDDPLAGLREQVGGQVLHEASRGRLQPSVVKAIVGESVPCSRTCSATSGAAAAWRPAAGDT